MKEGEEIRFRIDAYTPGTMPLSRLASYLSELATIFGEEKSVHLVELQSGSTVLVHKIDREALPKVRERTEAVRDGVGPQDAMRAFERVNRYLNEDNGSGVLTDGGCEVLIFPGREDHKPDYFRVDQQGEIDGQVVQIGGMKDPVPIVLDIDGKAVHGCRAPRIIAKPLANHLFEPCRFFGTGSWTRSLDGTWQLERFNVDRFAVLSNEPLSSVVLSLRALGGDDWGDDAVNDLLRDRYESEDA